MTLLLQGVTKTYGSKIAVKDVSFTVPEGQVFGLLGLNGAGKSTTIRMILDIMSPDEGRIEWRGSPVSASIRGKVGYLPEERGLYPQMRVLPQLVMFGRLCGLEKSVAMESAKRWLARFDITQYTNSFVSELSKGNQQKVQFIAAILHNPDLIVLDEPFSGLDPVNTELFKSVFRELVGANKTVLFSSHRLDHVEELCDAIAIIHGAQIVLHGHVDDIVAAEKPQWVRLGCDQAALLRHLPAGTPIEVTRGLMTIPIHACDPARLLQSLLADGTAVTHFELVRPTLTNIFLRKVGQGA